MTQDQKKQRQANRKLNAASVIAAMPETAKRNAYIVGSWVWCEFGKKPDKGTLAALKELGFIWNGKRKVWQHCGGVYRRRLVGRDPRDFYGMQPIEDQNL